MDSTIEKQLIYLIDQLIETKLQQNEDFLRFTYYEVIVKEKIDSKLEKEFLRLAQNKLSNMGYLVYLQDQEFFYNEARMKVQDNELIIAIKMREKDVGKWKKSIKNNQ